MDDAQINFFLDAVIKITIWQNPGTNNFSPVIDFIGPDSNGDDVTVNSYRADILFSHHNDAIGHAIAIANMFGFDLARFEEMKENQYEICLWDEKKQEHVSEVIEYIKLHIDKEKEGNVITGNGTMH